LLYKRQYAIDLQNEFPIHFLKIYSLRVLEDSPLEVGAGGNPMPLVQLVGNDRGRHLMMDGRRSSAKAWTPGKRSGSSMQGQSRTIRLSLLGVMMVLVALVMLSPTVSHAYQQDDPFAREFQHSKHHHKHQVPEPSTDVLLLGGIGFAGLVVYGWRRQQQRV
jgi:PEP-CTERM motif